ncbi:MAG: S1-like domain-containing RNA-binding protein [Bacteroidota bacterium]
MIAIGKHNLLKVKKETPQGYYLIQENDELEEEVLLPNKYIPEDLKVGDEINVFIYNDSEDRIIATTLEPKLLLDSFGALEVKDVNQFGAFMDWGLEKDLMVPFKEQNKKMAVGRKYIVYAFLDEETERIIASGKINKFVESEPEDLEEGQEVDLLIADTTDIGVNVIINNRYKGLVYKNELFKNVRLGDRTKGFIKQIREDDRIDVSLEKQGYANVEPNAEKILNALKENEGFLGLTDKSDPTDIQAELEMSKKTFKKAIGALYKQKLIELGDEGIFLK